MTLDDLGARLAAQRLAELEAQLVAAETEIAALQRHAEELKAEIAAAAARTDGADLIDRPLASERLTLVRGIDAAAAGLLNGCGITSFEDLAALTADDVGEIGRMLGDSRRISRECWIEQAAILATGADTQFSRRVVAGETVCLATPGMIATATAEQPTVAGTVADAPNAADVAANKVIDLAQRRDKRAKGRSARMRSLGRLAALGASIAFVLGVVVTGTGIHAEILNLVGGGLPCTHVGPADAGCPQVANAALVGGPLGAGH